VTKDGAIAIEGEVVDTITASRLQKLVRRVSWPKASLAPF